MDFTQQLVEAIGAWQNGWRENQERREALAIALMKETADLPDRFKTVSGPCYRKRFIHKGELAQIVLANERNEGLVSWTTDQVFAERFKNRYREGAVSGAIFRHTPAASEVVVNIPALWGSAEFVAAADQYRNANGRYAKALFNFADTQGEVVLSAPLKGSEIIALTGASSPFDDLCDQAGIDDEQERGRIFKILADRGEYPGEHRFIGEAASQRVIQKTIEKIQNLIQAAMDGTLNATDA
ncbi:hypothetical protein KDW69_19485 [Burkholderia ambifaria]|uniref:hypothetical protein n=1 Tax=Burkholderia ambifaria TaxID=152480 RepID=UPI001B9773F1|nr:hypothetical protein [Burkholderia ambifaria]MBR8333834.1 hypothetical protein [Burkholderia ambifaria]